MNRLTASNRTLLFIVLPVLSAASVIALFLDAFTASFRKEHLFRKWRVAEVQTGRDQQGLRNIEAIKRFKKKGRLDLSRAENPALTYSAYFFEPQTFGFKPELRRQKGRVELVNPDTETEMLVYLSPEGSKKSDSIYIYKATEDEMVSRIALSTDNGYTRSLKIIWRPAE